MPLMRYVGGPRCGDQANVDADVKRVIVPCIVGKAQHMRGTYNVRTRHSPVNGLELQVLMWDETSIARYPE